MQPDERRRIALRYGKHLQFRLLANSLLALNKDLNLQLDTLSMGMSGDLESAIEEGATFVRVGTDIFGQRTAFVH